MPADPLYAALSDALTRHGPVKAAAIQAAANAARRVLGTDRCTHHADTHRRHHTNSPVDGCPWCTATSPADRTPAPPAVTTIPTGGTL